MLEKTLESPLDCKEIQPVHPKGDQSWVFTGRTHVEAETPKLWPPDAKSWLTGKDPDAGKDWWQEGKGTTENEMVGWHHWLNGMGLGGLWELVMDREAWCAMIYGVAMSQTWLSEWTELNWTELMGLDAMILVFWMLSFKPTFSLSSFTFINRLFSSLLSDIRVMSSAYQRLLIFLPAIFIPVLFCPVWNFT